jgi:hypothetical protein
MVGILEEIRAGSMAEVVESCLASTSKCEALGSIPRTTKKKWIRN